MSKFFAPLIRVLSSYGLVCVVILLLFVLTLLGTVAQIDLGLHEAQKRYFDSFFLWQPLFSIGSLGVGLPLPGGQTLLWILFANLLVGGLIRIRKRRATAGIIITHIGIAVLLLAGFVKYYHSYEGHLTLYEGERCDEFESYYEYEIALTRDLGNGQIREYLIPGEQFVGMDRGSSLRFTNPDLPFDLTLRHFMRNGSPLPKGPMFSVNVPVVDGFYLRERAPAKDAELNTSCAYAELEEKGSGAVQMGLLVGRALSPSTTASNPWVTEVAGQTWAIDLRHRRFPLPFTIHLDDFTAKFHPRTGTASSYESEVTMIDGDVVQPLVIRMNEPLRDGGHVLFQSSYGPQGARPGDPMYSVFSVVKNPSDQWPLASCVIIALGLLIHFVSKLWRYILSQARRA